MNKLQLLRRLLDINGKMLSLMDIIVIDNLGMDSGIPLVNYSLFGGPQKKAMKANIKPAFMRVVEWRICVV